MVAVVASGLPADWLNAWLAAIGCTVLVPGLRLSWTDDEVPLAVLHGEFPTEEALLEAVGTAAEAIDYSHLAVTDGLSRTPAIAEYRERCERARATGDPTIGLLSDLIDDRERAAAGAFYVPGPGPASTLTKRFATLANRLQEPVGEQVVHAILGTADRIAWYGMGFDYSKVTIATDPVAKENLVVAGVELLAFAGLRLFPHRGDGQRAYTRGWTGGVSRRGAFQWPVWAAVCDAAAIDAMLDRFYSGRRSLGPSVAFEVVPYMPTGSSDNTRGYASRPVSP